MKLFEDAGVEGVKNEGIHKSSESNKENESEPHNKKEEQNGLMTSDPCSEDNLNGDDNVAGDCDKTTESIPDEAQEGEEECGQSDPVDQTAGDSTSNIDTETASTNKSPSQEDGDKEVESNSVKDSDDHGENGDESHSDSSVVNGTSKGKDEESLVKNGHSVDEPDSFYENNVDDLIASDDDNEQEDDKIEENDNNTEENDKNTEENDNITEEEDLNAEDKEANGKKSEHESGKSPSTVDEHADGKVEEGTTENGEDGTSENGEDGTTENGEDGTTENGEEGTTESGEDGTTENGEDKMETTDNLVEEEEASGNHEMDSGQSEDVSKDRVEEKDPKKATEKEAANDGDDNEAGNSFSMKIVNESAPSDEEDAKASSNVISLHPVASQGGESSSPEESESETEGTDEGEEEESCDTNGREEVDYEEALQVLNDIEKKGLARDEDAKKIKRPSSESTEEIKTKKIKLEEPTKEMPKMAVKVPKAVKTLSKKELEKLLVEKIVENMTNKEEVGRLRKALEASENENKKLKEKAKDLAKMTADLNTVVKKYINDARTSSNAQPVRITRSVGLQVFPPEKRLQPKAPVNKGPRQVRVPAAAQPNNQSLATAAAVNQAKPVPASVPPASISGRVITTSPRVTRVVVPTLSNGMVQTSGGVAVPVTAFRPIAPGPAPPATPIIPKPAQNKKAPEIVDLDDDEPPQYQPPVPVHPPPSMMQVTRPVNAMAPRLQFGGRQLNRPIHFIPRTNIALNPMTRQLRPLAIISAPVPPIPKGQMVSPGWKKIPPKPILDIQKKHNGIVLSWKINSILLEHEVISNYQIFAYQDTGVPVYDSSCWKKVGDVNALPLPMACTLTQFSKGDRYHFCVRAIDIRKRFGPCSDPVCITL